MSLSKFRKIYDKSSGAGRFVVSEGIAPSTYILPHVGLPTLWLDSEDDRFEIVIPKGCILSLVVDSNGDSRFVPANGSTGAFVWGDASVVNTETGATPASGAGTSVDSISVPAKSVPVGCAQFNALRPFDKGTSQAVSWITRGFVEWPLVAGLNDNLAVGDKVQSDFMGRPVKAVTGTDSYLSVGTVIEVEKFATNYDDGLLSYMLLPPDPGGLKDVYAILRSGPYQGKMGIRANLDVVNAVGAVRVSLTL